MRTIDADKVIEKLKEHKSLFCKNRVEFRALSDKDKARVDEIDTCIAELVNAEEVQTTDTDSDTISRAKAIEALKNDMASLDHIIKGMSANDVRLDAYVSQRNQVNYDIYTINNLPPAQPEQLSTNLAEVGTDCISRQAAIDVIDSFNVFESRCDQIKLEQMIGELPPAQPEIIRCKDCKHWIPYDWMFGEVWQSRNINDYPEDEIGCKYCDMTMKADDFCSRAEMREVTE